MLGHSDVNDCVPSSECHLDDISHPLSHNSLSGFQPVQPQSALVNSTSSFLSPICVMTNSVVNSVTGHGLYGLAKPLLMRTGDVKRACVKDKQSLQKDIVTQVYLGSKEKDKGLICHSASPAHVGQFISPIKYPTARDYKLLYKERLAESRVGVSRLYRKHHESDPRDVDTPFRNTNDCPGEPWSENPIRMQSLSHIFDVACRWLTAKCKKNGSLKFNKSQGGVSYLPEKSIKIWHLFSYCRIWIVWVLIM